MTLHWSDIYFKFLKRNFNVLKMKKATKEIINYYLKFTWISIENSTTKHTTHVSNCQTIGIPACVIYTNFLSTLSKRKGNAPKKYNKRTIVSATTMKFFLSAKSEKRRGLKRNRHSCFPQEIYLSHFRDLSDKIETLRVCRAATRFSSMQCWLTFHWTTFAPGYVRKKTTERLRSNVAELSEEN